MSGNDSFGQIDEETEQDFAAVLPPRARRDTEQAPAKRAAKKTTPSRSAAPSQQPTSGPSAQLGHEGPPSAAEADSVAPAATSTARRGRRPGSTSDRLVVLAPLAVRARMRSVQVETGKLYRDQVLDALEATVDDLPELIGRQNAPAVTKGKLFERTAASTPTSTVGEDRCQMTIPGFTVTQLQVIDSLVDSTRATGRSQLVATALQSVLAPT